jgi:hypothetical protein
MAEFKIEPTDNVIINHAGLTYIAKFLNNTMVFAQINQISHFKKNSGFISDYDVVKTVIALITLGKTSFEDVEDYRGDKFFKKVLNLKTVPSSVTIRQRIETYDSGMWSVLRQINTDFLYNYFQEEAVEIKGTNYIIVDSDVTPMDNSDTKKEGVAKTYKLFNGYSPMMSYTGKSGFMLNNELRPGDSHSNCFGTLEYFSQTINLAKQLGSYPLLSILDSGNDDQKLVKLFKEQGTEFIIKRNLRREGKDDYIAHALQYAEIDGVVEEVYKGCTKYYSNWSRNVKSVPVPVAVIVTEKTIDKKKQPLLYPEYEVEVYWNSLDLKAKEVEELYHKHGTMEQYHSEFKSDLDLERLPSGKFSSNYTIMLFGMISFNLLRMAGKDLLETKKVPGRRGSRLKLRTVIQNVMYMAGQYVAHARCNILKIFRGNKWMPAFNLII